VCVEVNPSEIVDGITTGPASAEGCNTGNHTINRVLLPKKNVARVQATRVCTNTANNTMGLHTNASMCNCQGTRGF
jgi:hypothetical protein